MSKWTALNVKFEDDDWDVPSITMSRITGHTDQTVVGDFDLLLDTFRTTNGYFVQNKLFDIAAWHGDIDTLVLVEGSDTSDMFTFKLLSEKGEVNQVWSNQRYRYDRMDAFDEIERMVGIRPSMGGNYRDHNA